MASTAPQAPHAGIDHASLRSGGRELLSVALMDARNHTLHLLALFEQALGPRVQLPSTLGAAPVQPLLLCGHVGWLSEYWIARNPQRALGAACPAEAVRLASIDPQADDLHDPRLQRSDSDLPAAQDVRSYLLETLEATLELLEKAGEDDASLYFYRMALFHEDWRGEQLAALAQAQGVALPLHLPPGTQAREPMGLPAGRWVLGWDERGFALDIECGREEVEVPDFDIDAQPVTWAQYVEFIADGGYDRAQFWRPEGWEWLQALAQHEGRRGPRHVEQIGVSSGAVLQTFFGRTVRMAGTQSVLHVSWWEADAFARWAGRRLPTEVEWELAAHAASRRGFRWGDVREWTATALRPWSGFVPAPWTATAGLDAQPVFGVARVQRGASFATRARMRHPKARGWALPGEDGAFVGFRTCGV